MQTILFPTDFSSNAAHAGQYAGMLAKRLDAHVVLLHSYPIPIHTGAEEKEHYDTEVSLLQSEKTAKKNMMVFAAQFIQETGIEADKISQKVEYGMTSQIIIDTAKSANADLIVMGTQGTTNDTVKWLGTNALNVIKAVDCPVWLVPENSEIKMPESIIYAADFQEDEMSATHKVLAIAKPLGTTFEVVHIHSYFDLSDAAQSKKMVTALESEFENEDVTFKKVNNFGIIGGLEKYIRNKKADVLALAVYEKSLLEPLFSSSVSQYFVKEAQLPVLTFRKQ